jgi:hypothetical protein
MDSEAAAANNKRQKRMETFSVSQSNKELFSHRFGIRNFSPSSF